MRVLVATNFLRDWSGSEVVALEVAEYFGADMTAFVSGHHYNTVPIDAINLSDYDLVWAQHQVLAVLLERMKDGDSRPAIVTAHLSPYHPTERPMLGLVNDYADLAVFNSEETREALSAGLTVPTEVFSNAAPAAFYREAGPSQLRTVLIISNHPPEELVTAARLLRRAGLKVRRVGLGSRPRRVTPTDIHAADAVISIGKTVSYALAARVPVYIYDWFGGDGWLTPENFEVNRWHNFSGRPQQRRIAAEKIVQEILSGPKVLPSAPPPLDAFLDQLPRKRQDFRATPNLASYAALTKIIWTFERRLDPLQKFGRALRLLPRTPRRAKLSEA